MKSLVALKFLFLIVLVAANNSTKPNAPIVKAVPIPESDSVILYITPGAGRTEAYEVELKNEDGEIVKSDTITATQQELRHELKSPLSIGESYEVSIKSRSAGRFSDEIKDFFNVDDQPVQGLQVLNVGKTSAEMTWARENGEINFRINVIRDGTQVSSFENIVETSHLIENLDHNQNYTIMVQGFDARNRLVSRTTKTITTKPLMVRDPTIVKTTDTSVKLAWTAETYASQYQIRVKNIKANTTEQAPLIPVKQVINGTTQFSTTYEIDLLRQATQYSIQIVAFDEKRRPGIPVPVPGEKPLTFTTNPAPVSSLSVNETFTRDGFLLVNWRPAFGAEYFELMVFDSQE